MPLPHTTVVTSSDSRVTIRTCLNTTSERLGLPSHLENSHGGRERTRIYLGRMVHDYYTGLVLFGMSAAPMPDSDSRS